MIFNDADTTVCGCDLSSPLTFIEFGMSATQLLVGASLFAQHRPDTQGARQTNRYFVVSIVNNVIYHSSKVIMRCLPIGRDSILASFVLHFLSVTGLSLVTILFLQSLMVGKLNSMGRLDSRSYIIYRMEEVAVLTLCTTVALGGASARFRPTASEEMRLLLDSVFVVMIILFIICFFLSTCFGAKACTVFYEAWQATYKELREGGADDMAKLSKINTAVKIQFLTALGGMLTASLFFLANAFEQMRSLRERVYERTPNEQLAQASAFFLYVAVFVSA